MGRLRNIIQAKVSGNVGAMSFRNRGAETVVAERSYTNSSKGDGASEKQRIHRSRLANIVNLFRVIRAIEARGWENKPAYVSDFNKFTSANLANSPIFLTKQEAQAGASVLAKYRVSRGSLPALAQSYTGSVFSLGIKLPQNYAINEATVADFSNNMIFFNDGWQLGDKLSIAQLKQGYVTIAGLTVPQVNVIYFEITLDAENTDIIGEMPNAGIVQLDVDANGNLKMLDGGDGAFAIHSRETSGQLLTSEQLLVLMNAANPITVKYSSDAQKKAAMDSYGYTEDVLLTPFSEVTAEETIPAQVTEVTLAGVDLDNGGTYTEGGVLSIVGENLSRSAVKLYNGSDLYQPTAYSATEQTYSIGYSGNYRIEVNGETMYQFTVNVPEPEITSAVFGSQTYTQVPVQMEDPVDYSQNNSIVVNGSALGELTCSGGTLSNVGGSATQRTGSFRANEGASFTISVGNIVVFAGMGSL